MRFTFFDYLTKLEDCANDYSLSLSGELLAENSEHPEIVAIKVLKESATREAEEDFSREVDIMSTFRHPNILTLLGVVLRGKHSVENTHDVYSIKFE